MVPPSRNLARKQIWAGLEPVWREARRADWLPLRFVFCPRLGLSDRPKSSIKLGPPHTCRTTRHCELVAADALLAERGAEALRRCKLYVTLEPCLMCAGALQHLGVPEVFDVLSLWQGRF